MVDANLDGSEWRGRMGSGFGGQPADGRWRLRSIGAGCGMGRRGWIGFGTRMGKRFIFVWFGVENGFVRYLCMGTGWGWRGENGLVAASICGSAFSYSTGVGRSLKLGVGAGWKQRDYRCEAGKNGYGPRMDTDRHGWETRGAVGGGTGTMGTGQAVPHVSAQPLTRLRRAHRQSTLRGCDSCGRLKTKLRRWPGCGEGRVPGAVSAGRTSPGIRRPGTRPVSESYRSLSAFIGVLSAASMWRPYAKARKIAMHDEQRFP
jgi:hypothetical protein